MMEAVRPLAPTRAAAGTPTLASRVQRAALPGTRATAEKLNISVFLLLLSLFIPWEVHAGSLTVSPYRLVLVFTVVPCLWMWMSGRAGTVRLPDIAIILYVAWCVLSFTLDHDIGVGIQSGGILAVESLGAYFLARCFVRSAEDFRRVCLVLFVMIMLVLPLAVVEWVTGQNIALRLFSLILPSHVEYRMAGRLGLERVQSVFEHPILFGVSCGSAFALSFVVLGWRKPFLQRWGTTALVGLAVVTSLSSGPISGMVAQGLLLAWGWVLRPLRWRWKILIALVVIALLGIEFFAKRSLPAVLLSSVALDMDNAYYRVLIWDFGFQSALNHPWFGVGFGRWDHASWMTQSIDMYWLYHAIVFGIPAAILMALTFFSSLLLIGGKKGLSDRDYAYRMGYLICMVGFFVVGWAVHFWNATYVLFLFLLGSGFWLLEAPQAEAAAPAPVKAGKLRRPASADLRPSLRIRQAGGRSRHA